MKIAIKNYQKKIPIHPRRISSSILNALSKEGVKKSGDITICFAGDKKIRQLNKKYHLRDSSTDVLAFDLSNDISRSLFADIAISVDTAIRNAKIFRTTPQDEINLYIVHGILHLLGYNDNNSRQRKIMNKKSDQILKNLYQ